MKNIGLIVPALMALTLELISATNAGATTYRITSLGPGKAYSISNNGAIVGNTVVNTTSQNWLSYGGVTYDLGDCSPSGVNLSGTVTGVVGLPNPVTTIYRACTRTSDTTSVLPSLPKTWEERGIAINDDGLVVGWSRVPVGQQQTVYSHACKWDDSGAHDLGTLSTGEQTSVACAVNNNGIIAGWSDNNRGYARACIWDNNGIHDLGTLNADVNANRYSYAYGINESGQVVGYSSTPSGPPSDRAYHAFIWDSNSGMRDLGSNSPMNDSFAWDINNTGQVVGSWRMRDRLDNHACIWNPDGSITTLGELPGYTRSEALSINDNGEIVGYLYGPGMYPNECAVIWTPVPEPSSIFTLLCGVSSLSLLALKKRK